MAPQTPAEWLPILAKRLDERYPRLVKLRSYSTGKAPLPEMGRNVKATWQAFQKKSRTDFGGAACRSHQNRIHLLGVRVGDNTEAPISLAARRISRDNRLAIQVGDALWDMLTASVGYLVVGVREDDRSLITREKPEQFYAEPDQVEPWRSRAWIKVWRDDIDHVDHAKVVMGGMEQRFVRSSRSTNGVDFVTAAGDDWRPATPEPATFAGDPTAYIFDRRDGLGLLEPHLDLIDRINLGKLQRLSTAAMQAFKQRALKKRDGAGLLPKKDAAGNAINWDEVFAPAPGALWDLPEGVDIWESGEANIQQLLDGELRDAREFGGVLGTPMSMLIPDGANQSATGAAATTAQQVDACRDDIGRIRLAIASAMLTALRIEGFEPAEGETIEADFENPQWVTLAEKLDAFSKAIAAGMSIQSAQRDILGWTDTQIEEDARNRRRERNLTAAVAQFSPQVNLGADAGAA